MTNYNQQSNTDSRQIHIGAKLQSAREMLRLDRKDAAAQLRLNENIIDMIETNSFPDDMPQIFIRGYIRSYGKLLQLPEEEINAAMAPAKPKQPAPEVQTAPAPIAAPRKPLLPQVKLLTNQKYLVQGLTAGIALVLFWQVAAWWRGHPSTPASSHANVAELSDSVDVIAPAGVSVQLARPKIDPVNTATLAAIDVNTGKLKNQPVSIHR